MASELSLTWDDHHKSLVGVFERLLDKSTLVDCTIAAEGQYLKAHKIILSACSPYFELLFSQENEKNPIVVLKDIKFQELKAMIDFIYRGTVKVSEERLKEFLDAAECLQIKGVGNGLCQEISPQNTGSEDPPTQRQRGPSSPLPCKRIRATDFGNVFERSDASTVSEVNFESESFQGSSNGFHVEAPCSLQDETSHPLSIATNSLTSLSDVFSEMKNLETTESVLFEKIPLTQCEEVHPNPDLVVVKNEPEEEEEVYIPETECYIEPKEEDISEDVALEGSGGETNSEPGTNQFSVLAFSTMAQSLTTTPETVSVSQMMETTNSIGAAPGLPNAREGGCPPLILPATVGGGFGGGFGEGRQVFRSENTAAPPLPAPTPKKPPHRPSCPECGKGCSSQSSLALHLRTHTGERPFDCDVCGNAFKSKVNLQSHQRMHTDERPFVCDVCGKAFRSKAQLQAHLRVHTGERPFACDVCGKAFRTKMQLQNHSAVHTDQRPFACVLCGKCFKARYSLRKHRRKMHPAS